MRHLSLFKIQNNKDKRRIVRVMKRNASHIALNRKRKGKNEKARKDIFFFRSLITFFYSHSLSLSFSFQAHIREHCSRCF